ncbi:MAG: hypothetical protein HOV81_16305 [Kofleriaceae bacterium]|nr:hypothetical protein [Kofleriaceae bacterium]
MRYLGVLVLASGCYGNDNYLEVLVPFYEYGTTVECAPETCALATGTTQPLELTHYITDFGEVATPDTITIEPEGIVAIESIGERIVVRALAPGDAAITFAQTTSDRVIEVTQHFQVRDVASVEIVPRRDGAALLDSGAVLHVLDGSTVTLRADRRGPAGEYLFGETTEPWTASAGGLMSATGTTGTLQKLEVHGLGDVDVRFGIAALAVTRVPANVVTRARIRVAERPALVAGDGQTLHIPEPASFLYVLDAFDSAGSYVAGTGMPGDTSVRGAAVGALDSERTFSIDPGGDRTVTAAVGPVTISVRVEFP